MQKAQSSLQPSWILMKARVRSGLRTGVGQPPTGSPVSARRSRMRAAIDGLSTLRRTMSAPVSVADVRRRRLGVAAGEHDLRVRREPPRQAHQVPRLAVGDVGDGAGVDHEGRGALRRPVDDADALAGQARGRSPRSRTG